MTVALGVVGYVVVGAVAARLAYILDVGYIRTQSSGREQQVFVAMFVLMLWPSLAMMGVAFGVPLGIGYLLTTPPKRERLAIRHAKALQRIDELERELR